MSVKKIKKEINLHSDFKIFVFGSFLKNIIYNDIDLLILYNEKTISIEEILFFRNELKYLYYNEYTSILDISLLSHFEESEVNFINKIGEYVEIKQTE